MRNPIRFVWLFLFCCCLAALPSRAAEKPNFIVMLVDDMGVFDLGCYGEPFFETPNINALAKNGMKFTQAYSACTVCSPTRASLLTGKYPATLKVTDWISGHKRPYAKLVPPDWTMNLPKGEITIAQQLKSAGYTTASIGKWHLGGTEFNPEHFGFDVNVAGYNKGSPNSYFSPYDNPYLKDGPEGESLTDRLTTETINFIRSNKEKPFFIYLPQYAVHTPIQAKKEVTEKYAAKRQPAGKKIKPEYAALVESVDDSIGALVRALEEMKLKESTYIIFTSDNGGLASVTSCKPLRAGKGSAYEGGVRIPLIVQGPGIKAGSTNNTPVITADLYSTVLELANVEANSKQAAEGVSLAGLLLKGSKTTERPLFWHYPHYHPGGAKPYSAVRSGDFKLIQFYEDGALELYNVAADISETNNLADKMPEKVQQLMVLLDQWRKKTGAQSPLPNPQHDPVKDANYRKNA